MAAEKSTDSPEKRVGIAGFALRNWLALVLAVIAVVFIAQNRDRVPVHLFWLTVTSPMWLLMAALFAGGWLVGMLLKRR